jgi:glycosyltransferase involved in cell wall biosynthesis
MPSVPIQGMERSNLQIMRMLKDRGADILCVTERDHGDLIVRELEQIGVPWVGVPCLTRLHLARTPRQMLAMIRGWRETASAVGRVVGAYRPTHIHVTCLTFFLLAWPVLRSARQRVVFRLPNPPDNGLSGYKQLLSNLVWRHGVMPYADRLVANCRYTVEQLRQVGANCDKVTVIPNCVATRHAPFLSDAPRIDPDRFNIVFTSKVRPEKGADFVIEAGMRMLRENLPVDLYLAGQHNWRNPFADRLKRQVSDLGMDKHIHFLGHIEDVFGLLKQCDLHVHPARREVFPNAVLEAKAHGVPSVVFRSGGLPEMVDHLRDSYLCAEQSADSLCQGIRHFLDDPEALQRAGAGAKRSLKRFSEDRISEMWAELYGSLR